MDFKPGDLVRLKSGGPAMVVEEIDKKDGSLMCLWFDDGQLESDTIASVALVAVESETPVPQP